MGESLNGLFDNIANGTGAVSEGASVILSKDVNKVIRECYLKSKPVNENGVPMRGYRQRMFPVWQEIGLLEQWWRSGESTRLPPMWPGFDSQTRRHLWVDFVGSLHCSERFCPGYSGLPLPSKTCI